jgi:nitrogen fixation protein NifX
MSYKIAVASSDGKSINEHFGKANDFLIYKVDGSNYKYLEQRQADSVCGNGELNEKKLLSAANALKGCRAVLASCIGNKAEKILRSKGIEPLEVNDIIENALKKLSNYYSKADGGKQTRVK